MNLELPSLINPDSGLDEREEYFLDILFTEANGSVAEAMKLSGYPKDYSITKLRSKLAKEIKQATKDYIVSQTPSAAISIVSVLTNPNEPGTANKIKAAENILNRGDVNKTEETGVIEAKNVIVLLPPKKVREIELGPGEYKPIEDLDEV